MLAAIKALFLNWYFFTTVSDCLSFMFNQILSSWNYCCSMDIKLLRFIYSCFTFMYMLIMSRHQQWVVPVLFSCWQWINRYIYSKNLHDVYQTLTIHCRIIFKKIEVDLLHIKACFHKLILFLYYLFFYVQVRSLALLVNPYTKYNWYPMIVYVYSI